MPTGQNKKPPHPEGQGDNSMYVEWKVVIWCVVNQIKKPATMNVAAKYFQKHPSLPKDSLDRPRSQKSRAIPKDKAATQRVLKLWLGFTSTCDQTSSP